MIHCEGDGCTAVFTPTRPTYAVWDARFSAGRQGWTYANGRGGGDRCPTCTPQRNADHLRRSVRDKGIGTYREHV